MTFDYVLMFYIIVTASLILGLLLFSSVVYMVYKKKRMAKKKDYFNDHRKQKETLGTILRKAFGQKTLDRDEYNRLEEILIQSDIGPVITAEVIDRLITENVSDIEEAIDFLKDNLKEYLIEKPIEIKDGELNIIFVLGVNGVGKTTSIAKIANYYLKLNKKVLLAAGDTFRAAATEQLHNWAKRLDIPIIKQGEGADPASVVFDAVDSAMSKKVDVLIIDTAGRLHNKAHLIEQLKKMERNITRKGDFNKTNLLVIDSTTGQNGYLQAETFHEAVGVDRIMLTKYDANTRGGIVFTIQKRLGIPFCFIGTGEKLENLDEFDCEKFVEKIFS